jgi:muramoyltetrapeptide carboxypeptidase
MPICTSLRSTPRCATAFRTIGQKPNRSRSPRSFPSGRRSAGPKRCNTPATPHPRNQIRDAAEGQLVGGNLKTIETLAGTRSDIDTAGKILFVEDTGEYLYSIDRMFWHSATDRQAGPAQRPHRRRVQESNPTTRAKNSAAPSTISSPNGSGPYGYPVCFDFPVGHQKENYAFKYGVPHTLTVGTDQVSLTEKTSIF